MVLTKAEIKNRLKATQTTQVTEEPLEIQCDSCGKIWTPLRYSNGDLMGVFWKCPNECNNEHVGDGWSGEVYRLRREERREEGRRKARG